MFEYRIYSVSNIQIVQMVRIICDNAEPDSPVLVPGDPERLREAEVSKSGGVSYSGSQHRRFRLMSEKFGVKPPPVKLN